VLNFYVTKPAFGAMFVVSLLIDCLVVTAIPGPGTELNVNVETLVSVFCFTVADFSRNQPTLRERRTLLMYSRKRFQQCLAPPLLEHNLASWSPFR
jgi:hypothetical protein